MYNVCTLCIFSTYIALSFVELGFSYRRARLAVIKQGCIHLSIGNYHISSSFLCVYVSCLTPVRSSPQFLTRRGP
ncbi:hypothetical protein F5Y03DRAFT_374546 [Xylaria venustula]|nr:hypothetical protein F5Y03DRAFT_374546 [Xylaria venustula]